MRGRLEVGSQNTGEEIIKIRVRSKRKGSRLSTTKGSILSCHFDEGEISDNRVQISPCSRNDNSE